MEDGIRAEVIESDVVVTNVPECLVVWDKPSGH